MKTVIEMARQVEAEGFAPVGIWPEVRRLCELVRADEREACMNALNALPYQRSTKYDCMDAIRARGNT